MGMQAYYTIGGMDLVLDGGEGVGAVKALPGFDVFGSTTDASRPVHIGLDRSVELPECRWLHRFDLEATGDEARFGIDAEGVYYHTFGGDGVLRFDSRRLDEVICTPVARPELLRFALWTAYALVGLWQRKVPIHASAVVCRGKAVACLGESGTGKSTHTRLWLNNIDGCRLLNDDSPILALDDDGTPQLHGSPWSGKTHCYHVEHYPVAAMLRLQQAPHNSIRRLGTLEAFGALQPSCPPALAHDERCLDRITDIISDVLTARPVYRLQCLPDADAARLSFKTIYPD